MLANPVTQEHDGQRITVTRGLTRGEKTELWVEFDGAPIPLEGAWLIKPNGERIDARFWQWMPDGTNPSGGYLLFPALSAEATPSILALPQGWRLQLDWIPARDAGLPSTELVVTYPAPTPLPGTPQPIARLPPRCRFAIPKRISRSACSRPSPIQKPPNCCWRSVPSAPGR